MVTRLSARGACGAGLGLSGVDIGLQGVTVARPLIGGCGDGGKWVAEAVIDANGSRAAVLCSTSHKSVIDANEPVQNLNADTRQHLTKTAFDP